MNNTSIENIEFESYLRSLVSENIVDGMLLYDLNGNFTVRNKKFNILFSNAYEFESEVSIDEIIEVFNDHVLDSELFLEDFILLNKNKRGKVLAEVELKNSTILEYYTIPILSKDEVLFGRCWFFRDISARKSIDVEKNSVLQSLTERVKELNCLYEMESIQSRNDLSIDEILETTVYVIPSAWPYSTITACRLEIYGKEYKTDNFEVTPWIKKSDIVEFDKTVGCIDVVYLEEIPLIDGIPFPADSNILINAIAKKIGQFLENLSTKNALIASEEKFRSVVHSANTAILVINNEMQIELFNETAQAIFKISEKKVLHRSFSLLTPKSQYGKFYDTVKDLFTEENQGKGMTFELNCLRDEKDEFPVEISVSTWITRKGRSIICIVTDIEERKFAEAQRLQEEKLKGVIETAGAACHELNQPLQVVCGYIEMMDYFNDLSDFKSKAKVIKVELDRIKLITSKMQNITKYETKDYVNESKILDIYKASE